jgi:tight adherence protein B
VIGVAGDALPYLLIAGLLASAAVVIAVLARITAERQAIQRALAQAKAPSRPSTDRRTRRLDDALSASPALRRAVEVTANLASRRGALGSVERSLQAADVPVRPAEVILGYVAVAIVVPGLTLLVTQATNPVLLAVALTWFGPPIALKVLVSQRRKKFVEQLPDGLLTLAGSLRAGRSIGQAMEALSKQVDDPLGRDLRKIVAELRLGRPLHEALIDAADRIGSPDFRWVVLSMEIQAEVGGNLAELLDGVAETMRERCRLRGEVKALTAEGRASALMLVIMPPALAFAMFAMNPKYMAPLIETTTGKILLAISAAMIGSGYAWMNSMVKIDV